MKPLSLLLTSLIYILATLSHAQAATNESPKKVGIIGPLTGPFAAWGLDVQNVLTFANKQLGGVDFQLIFEDDQCLGKNAVTAAQKLLNIDHADYAIVVCTESMLVTAPIFERNKTLVFAVVATGASVSNSGKYIFRTWPSDAEAARLLATRVSAEIPSIGIITEERGYSIEFENSFLVEASKLNLATQVNHFSSEETDFRSLLFKTKQSTVKGLFINTDSERLFATILRQFRELGLTLPIYGAYTPGQKLFRELVGPIPSRITYVDAPGSDSFTDAGKKLFGKYLEISEPVRSTEFVFGSSYEAMHLLKEISISKENPLEILSNRTFNGIFGKFRFDENGDLVGVEHRLKTLDGK